MISIIIAVIVALVILLIIVAANKPDAFRIERQITINAAPEKIFSIINDFHKWTLWSPWEKMDPDMSRTYSGCDAGVGSIYEWSGNKKVGQGRMELVEAEAFTRIFILLEFIKPFAAKNTAEFVLQAQGENTKVTWAMEGKHQFISKVMCTFMNMDKMVGKDFEEGLRNLQRIATE